LSGEFEKRGRLVRAYFYTALSEDGDFSNLRPLVDWLTYNRFTVRTKPVKEFDDGDGHRRVKRNMTVELAVDAMELAPYIDSAFVFSDDGDFKELIVAMQRRGIRTIVVSSTLTAPSVGAPGLEPGTR
jgi:uncharacterized LabA/DUF88 family protein